MDGAISDSGNTHLVGFSLPDSSVSSQDVRSGSDFLFYVLYVVSTIVLYTACVTTIFFLVSKTNKKETSSNNLSPIKAFTSKHPEVLKGVIVVILVFIFLEIIAEIVMAFIWTLYVKDTLIAFSVFTAALIYYGPGIFSLYKIVHKCHLYFNGHYLEKLTKEDISNSTSGASRKYTHEGDEANEHENVNSDTQVNMDTQTTENQHQENRDHLGSGHVTTSEEMGRDRLKHDAKIDTLFKCFVWIVSYFAYIVLYSFFPAFVLAFAYPTRIITVFAFISTFMILSVVYLTTFIKKGITLKACQCCQCDKDLPYHPFIKIFVWLMLISTLIYFYLFIFALLYALVIGRASVVSSAPLAILSLLPSILISIAAWTLKSTFLENNDDQNDGQSEEVIVVSRNRTVEDAIKSLRRSRAMTT